MLFYGIIAGAAIGILASVLFYAPRVKARQVLDAVTAERNLSLNKELHELNTAISKSQKQYSELTEKYSHIIDDISEKQEQAARSADIFYQEALNKVEAKLELDKKTAKESFETARNEYVDEYTNMLKELTNDYTTTINSINAQIYSTKSLLAQTETLLENERAVVDAAVEANKRAAAVEQKEHFYRIKLSDEDIVEITTLRGCLKYLRDSEPLNKVIWKTYYEKPTNDMIGRVVGSGVHIGIYKITNLKDGKCYVGQSNNIAERWKQHIKRGLGADTPTKNKLYPAMLEDGVENFRFEIIQECSAAELNEREAFWTDYFKAQEFGYCIRRG